jgi:hypothetical protein
MESADGDAGLSGVGVHVVVTDVKKILAVIKDGDAKKFLHRISPS